MAKKTEEYKKGYTDALKWVENWYGPDRRDWDSYDFEDLIPAMKRKTEEMNSSS